MTRVTTVDEALDFIAGICFKTGPPTCIGVELEWFPHDDRDPDRRPDPARLLQAFDHAAALPLVGALSMEPGGQWELSSQPAESIGELLAVTDRDMRLLRSTAKEFGLRLVGIGRDAGHPPRRILQAPRYAAMEEFFDRDNGFGRVMMCQTAAIQVSVDAGTDGAGLDGFQFRWQLAHLLGPILTWAFCRTERQSVWAELDPGRTKAPPLDHQDPRLAYAHYALDAKLLCVRRPEGLPWTAPPDLTLRDWIQTGALDTHDIGAPTLDDLAYHLTTLFPPVRARGHLELRVIDALPDDQWHVPTAFVSALFHDTQAADDAMAALELSPIRKAALACFEVALSALRRMSAPQELIAEVARYAEEELEWN